MKHSLTQTVQVLLLATIIVIVGAQAVALRALQQDVVTFMRTVDLLGDDEPLVASSAEPVERGHGPSVGTEDAPVTIVAFSDYDCPGCQQLMPALRQMVASAGDEMRLEYRHFPLHDRGASLRQALAAECAFRQETFWPLHDLLLERDGTTPEAIRDLAAQVGIEPVAFAACLESPEARARVQADRAAGIRFGVEGTPTLFVNGRKVMGSVSTDVLALLVRQLQESA